MSFNINKDLDIFLLTYNRVTELENTLKAIFSSDSPIRNLNITILDNCSNDGTRELIKRYIYKGYNINYIIHKRNIGGNGNITRAMELASKKYLWILCDDDTIDFRYWNEILYGMKNNYDVILTERKIDIDSYNDYHLIINTLAFVSAGIYKTENITLEVMTNAMLNIQNGFPHLVLAIFIINNRKKIYIPKHTILFQNIKFDFTRGMNNYISPHQAHFNIFSSYIDTFLLIKDRDIRFKCCDTLWIGKSFFYSVNAFFDIKPFYSYNLCKFFLGVNSRQKITIIWAIFLRYVIFKLFYFKVEYNRIKITLLFLTIIIKRKEKKRKEKKRKEKKRKEK